MRILKQLIGKEGTNMNKQLETIKIICGFADPLL